MSQIFLIGDTHFGHKNIITYEPTLRPFTTIEEHDEALIDRWNSVVTAQDTVWHLGDVLFGEKSFALLPRLKGIKKLVLGNHDHYPVARYAEHFTQIRGCAEVRGYILSHIPVHFTQNARFHGNIHGHLHAKSLDTPFHHNVSAEQINLTPIAFDALITA